MKKCVLHITMVACLLICIIEVKALVIDFDISCQTARHANKNTRNYLLVKNDVIPLTEANDIGKTKSPYKLVRIIDPHLKLYDNKGMSYWSMPTNPQPEPEIYEGQPYSKYEESQVNAAYFEQNNLPNPNLQGILALRDSTYKRWMLIDKTGKEILLPSKTGAMSCCGYIKNKYWLFLESDYTSEQIKQIAENDSYDPIPFDPMQYRWGRSSANINYFKSGRGWALFDDKGKLVKQAEIKYDGYLNSPLYFNGTFTRLVYGWGTDESDSNPRSVVSVYSTDGTLIKNYENPPFDLVYNYNVNASQTGSWLIISNRRHQYFLDLESGTIPTEVDKADFAVMSGTASKLILATGVSELCVIDALTGNPLCYINYPEITYLSDLQFSEDGTQFSLTARTDNSCEIVHYQLQP